MDSNGDFLYSKLLWITFEPKSNTMVNSKGQFLFLKLPFSQVQQNKTNSVLIFFNLEVYVYDGISTWISMHYHFVIYECLILTIMTESQLNYSGQLWLKLFFSKLIILTDDIYVFNHYIIKNCFFSKELMQGKDSKKFGHNSVLLKIINHIPKSMKA